MDSGENGYGYDGENNGREGEKDFWAVHD